MYKVEYFSFDVDPKQEATRKKKAEQEKKDRFTNRISKKPFYTLLAMIDRRGFYARFFSENLRKDAVNALAESGDKRAVMPLVTTLIEDPSKAVRWAAAAALGQLGGDELVFPLTLALNDKFDGVRVGAAEALGMIGNESAAHVLIDKLDDPAHDVRFAASLALVKLAKNIQNPEPVIAHLAMTKAVKVNRGEWEGQQAFVRAQAVKFLGLLKSPKATEMLCKLLADKNGMVVKEAVTAIRSIGDRKALKPVLAFLKNRTPILEYGDMNEAFTVAARMANEMGAKDQLLALRADKFRIRIHPNIDKALVEAKDKGVASTKSLAINNLNRKM
jgi:HEAT repeat protein